MKNRVLRNSEIGRVKALLGVLKLNDEEAYQHSLDVANIVNLYLELEEKKKFNNREEVEKQSIIIGALLHDIGKAFLPFGLQYSSKKFDSYEVEIMNMHPVLGTVAIKNCEFDDIVKNIILMHHACPDGTGHPRMKNIPYGLGDGMIDVPEYVWIVAYADKLDAMISRRNFRRQKSLKEAWTELVNQSKNNKLTYEPLIIYQEIIKDMDIFKKENEAEKYLLDFSGMIDFEKRIIL